MASRFDNWANVALEALAAGRPVVCTRGTGISELVGRLDPDAVAPVDDPARLAQCLRPYLVSPALAADVGRRGRDLVTAELSVAAIAQKMEAVYEEAIARRTSRAAARRSVRLSSAFPSAASFWGMVRRHLWVSGRVQGVWYRGSCAERAGALGISGWARNLPDGRVEIVAEGHLDAVDQLVDWCRHGPPAARVTAVEVQVEEPEGVLGFDVR